MDLTRIYLEHTIFVALPTKISEEVVINLGKALGSESLDRGISDFIIGRDGRLSSPHIFEWLSSGVLSTGCNVIDIGLVNKPYVLSFGPYELSTSSGL